MTASRASLLRFLQKRTVGYVFSVLGTVAVVLLLWPFYPHVRGITASTALLIVVLLSATFWGMGPALVASLLGVACLNFFYVPPPMKFQIPIADGDDMLALVAFLVASVLVGQLSSRAQRRARQVQELYDELRSAFDRTSQLEALRQSERLKAALLDTVTHDLRTPLTSIKAASTALIDVWKSGSANPRLVRASEEHLVGIIVQQSDRLNHFIEGMIELAKIEAGEEQSRQNQDASPVEEIIAAALARVDEALRNHIVNVECEENLCTTTKPKAIAQVLFSLLENAGKYAPPGTTIRVAAERIDGNGVQVAVEDEGPGVPPQLRDKVFEKFFRCDLVEQGKNPTPGLGLGLAIAKGIVETYGGKIWAEDCSPNKSGARFVFTIPTETKVEAPQTLDTVAR